MYLSSGGLSAGIGYGTQTDGEDFLDGKSVKMDKAVDLGNIGRVFELIRSSPSLGGARSSKHSRPRGGEARHRSPLRRTAAPP